MIPREGATPLPLLTSDSSLTLYLQIRGSRSLLSLLPLPRKKGLLKPKVLKVAAAAEASNFGKRKPSLALTLHLRKKRRAGSKANGGWLFPLGGESGLR